MTVSLTSEQIAIDRIKTDAHQRPNEEIVRQLMISIPQVGLLQPIVLNRPGTSLGINLVFGASRLEALKRLKLRATLARVVNGTTAEIVAWIEQARRDENMIRFIHLGPADPAIVSLIERRRAAVA